MIQPSDKLRPDELAVWKLSGDDVRSNQSVPLTALNEDNLAVAAGIDGRVSGVMRRDLGNLLYANLQKVAPVRDDGTVISGYTKDSISDWFADQLGAGSPFECVGVYPFRIEETNGTKFVYGLLLQTRVAEPTLDGAAGPLHTTLWRYRLHLFYTSESRSSDRPSIDYTVVLLPPAAPGEPSWWRRDNAPYDDRDDDLDYDFPVSVYSQGRYLYVGPSHTLSSAGDLAEVQPPVALWFDATAYNDSDAAVRGDMDGWRSDWFGFVSTYPNGNRAFDRDVQPPQPVVAHETGIINRVAAGPEGRYLFSYRYVDFDRGRISNFASPIEIDQPFIHRDTSGNPTDKNWGVFMTDGWRTFVGSADPDIREEYRNWIAKLAGPGPLEPGAAYYQVISTLSSGDLGTAGGGRFYVHDTMTTTVTQAGVGTGWDYNASNPATDFHDVIGLKVLAFESGAIDSDGNPIGRQDNEFTANSSTIDIMTVGDLGLVVTPPISGLYDTMRTPISWLDATFFQGLSFIASPDGGYIRVHWSDPRGYFPETFPLGCSELTTCRVNVRPEGSWTLSPFDVRFIQAGDFLYLFADGQIIQIRRNGTSVEFIPLYRGFQLLNKYCVCSNGTALFFATRKGFFMLDGNSASLGKLDGLQRLIRDRWSSPVIQSGISCSFDENIGAVYIQSARTAETCVVHLDTHRIMFRVGTNFKWCVEADFPTDDGGTAKQVYFVSEKGLRVVRPRLYYNPYSGEDEPPYTTHGIETNPKIRMVTDVLSSGQPLGTTWENGGFTTLTLDDDLLKVADLSEVTVSFLSGPLKGQVFGTIPTVHRYSDGVPMDESTNEVSIGVDLNWTDADPSEVYVAISTIPVVIVGGPLAFMTDQSGPADSFKRRQVTTAIASFNHISQQEVQTVAIPYFYVGVGRPESVHGWEPLGTSATDYGPSYGPFTTWFTPVNDSADYTPDAYVDPVSDGRAPVLVGFPANNIEPDVTDAQKNVAYIKASMRQPCPIFFSLTPDLNFDLRELRFKGIIGTTDVDRKA